MRTTLSVAAALVVAASLGAQQSSSGHPVTCNDGTTDVSTHKGACGKHGGIKPGPGAVQVNAPPAQGAVAVNAPPSKGAVRVNAPGGTPAAAPMATQAAPVGIAHPAPAPAPGGGTKIMLPASAPVIAPAHANAASPRDPATHSSPRDASVNTKLDHATAKCKDGMYSHNTNPQLQCVGHQGVGTHLGTSSSH